MIKLEKGLNEDIIKRISNIKKEPKWMLEFRLKSYEVFKKKTVNFGPKININFDNIIYFKKMSDEVSSDWKKINCKARKIFKNLGLMEAEEKYLGGISTQYESEVIYHSMLKELYDKNIIFVDTDTALKKYPKLFKKYFNKIVKYDDNKYSALNTSVWSGGTFIYIPKNTKLDRPLQSYFRINSKNMGQFERTIIIVDENSELEYIEGCTAPIYSSDSLHAAVVEIYVEKNAKCRYVTIQNWAKNIYNLVTKRALVKENATMEWIDGNIGSKTNMKYPCCILKGDNSKGNCISIALADKNQTQDTGAKMIHLGKNTKSNIVSKSIARNKGTANYRGLVKITKNATNSYSSVKCDTILLDDISKSDTIPININNNKSSIIEHEATVSKISDENLFYLTSRGIDEDRAKEMLIIGFIDVFKNELPMEYAVELNNLMKNKF